MSEINYLELAHTYFKYEHDPTKQICIAASLISIAESLDKLVQVQESRQPTVIEVHDRMR